MKKTKLILALLAILPFTRAVAQQGEILYTDLNPDPFLHVTVSYEQLCLDLNFDTIPDMCMSYHLEAFWVDFTIRSIQDNLMLCHGLNDDNVIADVEDWQTICYFVGNPDSLTNMGFRYEIDGDYYYGWFRTYNNLSERNWYFDEFAFCTIPNYPLRWGQTSLTGIEEEDIGTQAFATVHPNPTTGLVTVAGENLKQAEILNTLGQVVATAQGNGHSLTIDIGHLPASIYFVSITDETGRKCVRKVVKE